MLILPLIISSLITGKTTSLALGRSGSYSCSCFWTDHKNLNLVESMNRIIICVISLQSLGFPISKTEISNPKKKRVCHPLVGPSVCATEDEREIAIC